MGINEIYDLLKKYREHRCTPEEEERIARWYEQFDDEVENLPEVPEGKLEQLWFFIKRKIYVPWTWRVVVFYRYAVAIIILAMLGSGVIYFRGSDEPERQELTQQDILPAQGVAVLQLSDGREVPLNSTTIIQEQEGVVIKNDSSHVLDYTFEDNNTEDPEQVLPGIQAALRESGLEDQFSELFPMRLGYVRAGTAAEAVFTMDAVMDALRGLPQSEDRDLLLNNLSYVAATWRETI